MLMCMMAVAVVVMVVGGGAGLLATGRGQSAAAAGGGRHHVRSTSPAAAAASWRALGPLTLAVAVALRHATCDMRHGRAACLCMCMPPPSSPASWRAQQECRVQSAGTGAHPHPTSIRTADMDDMDAP